HGLIQPGPGLGGKACVHVVDNAPVDFHGKAPFRATESNRVKGISSILRGITVNVAPVQEDFSSAPSGA
ncbi:MAG: hypothetical protein J7M32_00290, partial [Deltaproteobacteria bacterium]|nr:hypothetical protein [Deltaproteobacteria bacterium]